MANTYSSIYLHLVFAVKHRNALLIAISRPRIFQYMSTTIRNLGHIPVAMGGTDNHVHILFKYNMQSLIPDLVRELKAHTSKFINDELLLIHKFEWQRGYGVFSHSARELPDIIRYVQTQPEHHKDMSLQQEIRLMLERFGVAYDEKYIFEDI